MPTARSTSSASFPTSASKSRKSSRARSAPRKVTPVRTPDELRGLIDAYLHELALTPELHAQADSMRYALSVGGKRVRPVICLATAEAAGCDAEMALPAAASVELVHNLGPVHDDLPALDNDTVRRGAPAVWGGAREAVGILAGDALLAEAFRLALSYSSLVDGRELAQA